MYDFSMLDGIDSIAVALSGGKDSLTLLYMLHAISGRGFFPYKLHAIFVAGEYTCGAGVSEKLLKSICEKLEINLIICQSTQKLETLECYNCSRERRSLLFEAAKKVGAQAVAFGHHSDDNSQTVLMNLLHKAEFAGNLPKLYMHDYDITILRPLIYVSEQLIRSFAKQNNFLRISCQCPVGQNSMRRQVDQLLSEIERLFPNARENIARAGLVYGSDKATKKKEST
jgi:tRNA(Ile)-lysidine synthase TilS/MesJ